MNRFRLLVAGMALPFIAQAAAPAPKPDLPAFELALIDMQGQKKVLGTLPGSVFAPRVSPDGTRVAFELADDSLPKQPDNRRLYVAELDKLDKRHPLQVTVTTTRNLAPVWSDESDGIAFLASGMLRTPFSGSVRMARYSPCTWWMEELPRAGTRAGC